MPDKTASKKLKVVLCWHMHQPQYRDSPQGEYQLPWTYLHAIKDYTDMAYHLEQVPKARAVVNFAPTLLEQIDDYAQQVGAYLHTGDPIHDPLLAVLAHPVLPEEPERKLAIIGECLRANEHRLIKRFPPYARLAKMAHWYIANPEAIIYLNEQFLGDLVMWYHLAWMGESIRREDERVQELIKKGQGYSSRDRRLLVNIIGELLSEILPRYRRLAEKGKVELSVTPYAHPIVPLLIDIQSTLEAMPDAHLPLAETYPGGEARVRWHMQEGIKTFEHFFGMKPKGCWPSEGSVSTAAMAFFEEAGIEWVASGENVLHHTLAQAQSTLPVGENRCLHQAFRIAGHKPLCFFRDDGLSDLIGFTYSDWHADDAVANLLTHLDNIANACHDVPDAVVSIILDGENAWEYYPENGYYFLAALYKGLANHPRLELSTFSDAIRSGLKPQSLSRLVAGSWVYGTFSTWIGEQDKNRAWDMLVEAKRCYDRVMAAGHLDTEQRQAAERQLAICEGSDWFWWFGDYNPAEAVRDFERLYRRQLTALYHVLMVEPPEYLSHVFAHGGGVPQMGGVMRRGSEY